jgi:hypothetical protein
MMQTQKLHTFLVRESFGVYKKGDVFQANSTPFVRGLLEMFNFSLESGDEILNIPASAVKFKDKPFEKE